MPTNRFGDLQKRIPTLIVILVSGIVAVLFNSSIGDWFQTTVGVRQGCLLSPTLFNIYLERIMTDALEDHEGTGSILVEQSPTSALLMTLMA